MEQVTEIEVETSQRAPETAIATYIEPIEAYNSEDEAKAFIYMKESGNRLYATNSIGCIGLGQDCSGRLAIECPNWQTDRTCQEVFWQNYMNSRYGTWNKAKQHWLARVPINGKDVGNWW